MYAAGLLPSALLGWTFGWRAGLGAAVFTLLPMWLSGMAVGIIPLDTFIVSGLFYSISGALFGGLYDTIKQSSHNAIELRNYMDYLQAERHDRQKSEHDLECMNQELEKLNKRLEGVNADLEVNMTLRTVELQESQQRYALAVRGTNEGIWDWDIRTGEAYFSPRWYEITGLEERIDAVPEEDIETWLGRVHQDDADRVKKDLALHINGVTEHLESEHRIRHSDGSYRWTLVRGMVRRDCEGNAVYMAGSLGDITKRKTLEGQLEHAALFDALTGLPNRALFMDRLGQILERIKRRPDGQFAVMVINLDRFRLVNDSYGHNYGDALLKAIVRRLSARLRTEDTLARLGGDELGLLVEDASTGAEAIMVAERILDEFKEPFIVNGRTIYSDASIGIKLAAADPPNVNDLLRDASTAMFQAKAAGRGRYEIYNRKMHNLVVEQIQLQTDLRLAVQRDEFRVVYQPLINLKTGIIAGFEALARWQHPQRGLLEPGKFIPAAEESGIIEQIDLFVLREACKQGVIWHRQFDLQPPLSISVNLSGTHFSNLLLVEKIETILEDTGFSPHSLGLEVTESAMMANTETANEVIARLKQRGISFHMDDFGTGYSSLSYLHRFPFHTLKIDRSFIRNLSQHPENVEIVQAIIALANNLEMQVIAEGIEHADDLRSVQDLSCGLGQGYLFSRPISGDEAKNLLAAEMQRSG